MNSGLLARLMAADPAERQWLLLESVLESVPRSVRQAVWAVAVPHWFDDRILAALCPELANQSTEIYQALQALSFVEVFEGRGHNIHEATRSLLLNRLWTDRTDEFKLISARAAEYFENDESNVAEWLYHKSIGEPIGDELGTAMQPLDHNFRQSESEAILKALKEQIAANRVDATVTAEVTYWSGCVHHRFYEADEALENYARAIEIYRQVGARIGEANTLQAIGLVMSQQGNHRQAIPMVEQSLNIYREIGDRYNQANVLKNLAVLYNQTGRLKECFALSQESTEIFTELGLLSYAFPPWINKLVAFAKQSRIQLILCCVGGVVAFPFMLIALITILLWRLLFGWLKR